MNHLAHFLLTDLLRERLIRSSPSRVVAVSSGAEGMAYKEGIAFNKWPVFAMLLV